MPVGHRTQVCVGTEPTRGWLLHAYTGHAGMLAASRQSGQLDGEDLAVAFGVDHSSTLVLGDSGA